MNDQNFVGEEQPKLKPPVGSVILIVSQLISLLTAIIPQIKELFNRMGESQYHGHEGVMGEYYISTYSYISTQTWMSILILTTIALLAMANKYKLINLVLLCEVCVTAVINFLQVLFNARYYFYQGGAGTLILGDLCYCLLVLTVFLFALKNFGVSALNKIPNNVIMIVSAISFAGVVLFNIGDIRDPYFGGIRGIYIFGYLGSLLKWLGLLLIGVRFANPYEKVSTSGETVDGTFAAAKDYYISIGKHVCLLLFTCGIWMYIWICKVTKFTNLSGGEEERNPVVQLLLCLFIPFYSIYWTYKTASQIDAIAKEHGVASGLKTPCLILAIFVGIVPPILMQGKINELAQKN